MVYETALCVGLVQYVPAQVCGIRLLNGICFELYGETTFGMIYP